MAQTGEGTPPRQQGFDPFASSSSAKNSGIQNAHGQTYDRSTPSNRGLVGGGGEMVGKYILGRVLGAGDFDSRTRLCTNSQTGQEYAVKIYNKALLASYSWMWTQVRDSVHIMRLLPKHENLIGMVECFETKSSLYILMQMHSPNRISRMYTTESPVLMPIRTTRDLFSQTVRGILHLHTNNVAHLGLAPDHVMVNESGHVKIGNMVSCRAIGSGLIADLRGTTRTVAPEVLSGELYDPRQADAWALGVLLYFMMASGRYPHDGANTTKHILANQIRPLPEDVDSDARDLIHRLLQMNPRRRMRVEEVLDHAFFDEDDDEEEEDEYEGVVTLSLCATAKSDDSPQRVGQRNPEGDGKALAGKGDSVDALTEGEIRDSTGRRGSSRGRRRQSSVSSAGGLPPPLPRSLARTIWSEKEGLAIVLPEDLPRHEEAAYLIQHTFRLYMLKKEEHWDLKISKKGTLAQLLHIKREGSSKGFSSRRRAHPHQQHTEGPFQHHRKSFSEGVKRGSSLAGGYPSWSPPPPSHLESHAVRQGSSLFAPPLSQNRPYLDGGGSEADYDLRTSHSNGGGLGASKYNNSGDTSSEDEDISEDENNNKRGGRVNRRVPQTAFHHPSAPTFGLGNLPENNQELGIGRDPRRRRHRESAATNTNSNSNSNSNAATGSQLPLLPPPSTADEHAFLLGLQQGLLIASQQNVNMSHQHTQGRVSNGSRSTSTTIEAAGGRRQQRGRGSSTSTSTSRQDDGHEREFVGRVAASSSSDFGGEKEGISESGKPRHKLSMTAQPMPTKTPQAGAGDEGQGCIDKTAVGSRVSPTPSAQRRFSNTSLSLRKLSDASLIEGTAEDTSLTNMGGVGSIVGGASKSPTNESFAFASSSLVAGHFGASGVTPSPPRGNTSGLHVSPRLQLGLGGGEGRATPRPPSLSPAFVENAVAVASRISLTNSSSPYNRSNTGGGGGGGIIHFVSSPPQTPTPSSGAFSRNSMQMTRSYMTPFAPATPMGGTPAAHSRQQFSYFGDSSSTPPSSSPHGAVGYSSSAHEAQTARIFNPFGRVAGGSLTSTRSCFTPRGPAACGTKPFPDTPFTFTTKVTATTRKKDNDETSSGGGMASDPASASSSTPPRHQRGVYLKKKRSTASGRSESPIRPPTSAPIPATTSSTAQSRPQEGLGGTPAATAPTAHFMGAAQKSAMSSSAFRRSSLVSDGEVGSAAVRLPLI